eukprot:scaffold68463_cov89-Cyclotella_meneghiniana.AAC.1
MQDLPMFSKHTGGNGPPTNSAPQKCQSCTVERYRSVQSGTAVPLSGTRRYKLFGDSIICRRMYS